MTQLHKKVAKNLIVCALGTASCLNGALAQNPDSFSNKSATDLFRQYQNSKPNALEGQRILIGVLNRRLPANDENLRAVRASLAKTSSPDEKVMLIKVLASMYAPGPHSQQNTLIENDMKVLLNSPNLRIAREAVLGYSRLGYPPDRYQVLQHAHANKIINNDTYYGELAHGLRLSSNSDQALMLSELERAQNQFANEILATTFGNPQLLGQLTRADQGRVFRLLSDNEPTFPMAIDSFGVVDSVRYALWINAVATIDSALNGKTYAQVVLTRLSDQKTDPRKILSVFSNPEGKRVLNQTNDIATLRTLLERAEAFSYSLPQNDNVRDALAIFVMQLRARTSRNGR